MESKLGGGGRLETFARGQGQPLVTVEACELVETWKTVDKNVLGQRLARVARSPWGELVMGLQRGLAESLLALVMAEPLATRLYRTSFRARLGEVVDRRLVR